MTNTDYFSLLSDVVWFDDDLVSFLFQLYLKDWQTISFIEGQSPLT